MVLFQAGQLRVELVPNGVSFRAVGENNEPGVEEALNDIGAIHDRCRQHGVPHEALERKYGDGKRVDAVQLRFGRPEARRVMAMVAQDGGVRITGFPPGGKVQITLEGAGE